MSVPVIKPSMQKAGIIRPFCFTIFCQLFVLIYIFAIRFFKESLPGWRNW
jgi:hypothetical protein